MIIFDTTKINKTLPKIQTPVKNLQKITLPTGARHSKTESQRGCADAKSAWNTETLNPTKQAPIMCAETEDKWNESNTTQFNTHQIQLNSWSNTASTVQMNRSLNPILNLELPPTPHPLIKDQWTVNEHSPRNDSFSSVSKIHVNRLLIDQKLEEQQHLKTHVLFLKLLKMRYRPFWKGFPRIKPIKWKW